MIDGNSVRINALKPSADDITHIAAVLADGGVVGMPTDTLYGLTVRIDKPDQMVHLRKIKETPIDSPFLFLAHPAQMAFEYWTTPLPEQVLHLVHTLWPGPLTVIYHSRFRNKAMAADGTLAFRVPDLPFLTSLIDACGVPLASTSANLHGRQPARDADEARMQFAGVDLWVESRMPENELPSTVFNAVSGRLVRVGRIPTEEVMQVWSGAR